MAVKKLGKVALLAASIVFVAALLLASFAMAHAYSERRKAEAFLNVLRQIRVGVTDQANVMRMTDPFRTHRPNYDNDIEMEFLFYNEWLVRLKLAAPAEFKTNIRIKNGVVVEKSAREASWTSGCVGRVREFKRDVFYPDEIGPNKHPNHHVYWEEHSPQVSRNTVRRILIDDDDTYPELQRQRDWDFNLSCLTRLGSGCLDTRTMLPNAAPPQVGGQQGSVGPGELPRFPALFEQHRRKPSDSASVS